MPPLKCISGICFYALSQSEPKIFGFAEFLSGLALMALVWTIADVRYKFRIRTAPVQLQNLTFVLIFSIGLFALLTDLWRASEWYVPFGHFLTSAIWQSLLAFGLLACFFSLCWFAILRPYPFGRLNALRFGRALHQVILKGDDFELAVVADELAHSIRAVVQMAPDRKKNSYFPKLTSGGREKLKPENEIADQILLLIADKGFCRALVRAAPGTIWALFDEMQKCGRYGIQVKIFARNVFWEALENKESFVYRESGGYDSGLIGYHGLLSKAIFSNYEMVEAIATLLDVPGYRIPEFDKDQAEAYCRICLITFASYVSGYWPRHSYALFGAGEHIKSLPIDLYRLNGLRYDQWNPDIVGRLDAAVDFVQRAVQLLDENGAPPVGVLRRKEKPRPLTETFYDHLADIAFELIFAASSVESPRGECWQIRHNKVWSELFQFPANDAGKIMNHKLRRLIYDEIDRMRKFPNFKGARILQVVLDMTSLVPRKDSIFRVHYAIQKAVLSWMRKNYVALENANSEVAATCLPSNMKYLKEERKIEWRIPAGGLSTESKNFYIDLVG